MNAITEPSFETYAQLAANGDLPPGFDQWALADRDGWTVAHIALAKGALPADFDQWTLADQDGWTVAHVAAVYGHLPPGFDRWWALTDKGGVMVAHVAARHGHLPSDFDQWALTNTEGKTVVDAAREAGNAKSLAQYEAWQLRQAVGETKPAPARIARSRT